MRIAVQSPSVIFKHTVYLSSSAANVHTGIVYIQSALGMCTMSRLLCSSRVTCVPNNNNSGKA